MTRLKTRARIFVLVGIALFPHHGEDTDALLPVADMALYAAKGAGRDRVVVGAEKRSSPVGCAT